MARVVLDQVSKTFQGPKREPIVALRQASLAVEDGQFVVLLGPSGCGKSTTLRLIAGLETVDAGTISIDGVVVNEVEPQDRDIAMVFQNTALYPHLTAYENLALGLRLRKFSRAEIERRVGETAQLLGLASCLDRLPRALSGGQRQRVAVGRALVRKPRLFLFDEPLSNLDAQLRGQLRTEIAKLHRRLGTTMIYVTHDQAEAMTLGDRIAVMKDGAMQQTADPLTLYHQPANLFVARFVGSPPMNALRGTLVEQGGALWFRETNPAAPLLAALTELQRQGLAGHVGRDVVLGLRPEHILASSPPGAAPDATEVAATLEMVEPLGAETLLHFSTGAQSFVVRGPADTAEPVNGRMPLLFDMGRAHFFDAKTGRVLEPAAPPPGELT